MLLLDLLYESTNLRILHCNSKYRRIFKLQRHQNPFFLMLITPLTCPYLYLHLSIL